MKFVVVAVLFFCAAVSSATERENSTFVDATPVSVGIFLEPTLTAESKPPETKSEKSDEPAGAQVRLVAMKTDIPQRCRRMIPALPCPPFSTWRRWLFEHFNAVHCSLEWRTESGEWNHAELRSTRDFDKQENVRVGWGELPATGYVAYGIYISKGRLPRSGNSIGHQIEITLDEEIQCDYRQLEREIRNYASREFGCNPGRAGDSSENRGLGGPAFKPSQNSNTMVNYVLKACGVSKKSPENAVGWDTCPHFPYSTNKGTFEYDNQP